MTADGTVVVWGNCQAGPVADLLRAPLARHGLRVAEVPPVFLVDEAGLARVRALVARSAVLISQPVSDDYRLAGCGLAQLAEHLPASGRLVTFPVTFHVGAFPYQVHAHGGDGARVDAPLTDYADLRALVAAERGLTPAQALAWWPAPEAAAVRRVSADSLERLRRREARLDLATSHLVDDPGALWTMTHPTNALLGQVARALLRLLGVDEPVELPVREFLGARRAPLEPAVAAAHGWPADRTGTLWRVDGEPVPAEHLLATQLAGYAARPDVVADTRVRYAERLAALGL